MAKPQRDDPPTPRLRPTLKLRHDKLADKYDPPSLLRASAFAEATADKTARQIGGSSALLEYAVMHGDEAEAARLRAELCRLVEKV